MTMDEAVQLAESDLAELSAALGGVGSGLVLDGSMYSPSWRALDGGAQVWAADDGDLTDAYVEVLDEGTDALGLYWEDGCLWRSSDNEEGDDD